MEQECAIGHEMLTQDVRGISAPIGRRSSSSQPPILFTRSSSRLDRPNIYFGVDTRFSSRRRLGAIRPIIMLCHWRMSPSWLYCAARAPVSLASRPIIAIRPNHRPLSMRRNICMSCCIINADAWPSYRYACRHGASVPMLRISGPPSLHRGAR